MSSPIFEHISMVALPKYFKELSERIKNPLPMDKFYEFGIGEREISNSIRSHFEMESREEFQGCYVFTEGKANKYVGISKTIIHRIRQHLKGVNYTHSSLAYKLAKEKLNLGLTSKENMRNPEFLNEFKLAQKRISTWGLSVVEILDPIELYLFEVYASLELKTTYNSFETH